MDSLIAPRFLFRFSVPLMHAGKLSDDVTPLSAAYSLEPLAELDGKRTFADVRGAWHEEGLAFQVSIRGKQQPIWCRDSRPEDSDGLQLWIDTRDTHNIHRASRYCHRFFFLPAGTGPRNAAPAADQLLINRARENAKPIRPNALEVRRQLHQDGYDLFGNLPTEVLTGYDPSEHPRLGFTYAVLDRELGLQTFSVGTDFPYEEDPSIWATLELE